MKQIRIPVALLAVMALFGANAATLRVNNAASAVAQFTSVTDALDAASDGDVIILEPSVTSYGDFEIRKSVTIKGGGFLMNVNHPTDTGGADSQAGKITVKSQGVTLTGLNLNNIVIYASNTVVTRCLVNYSFEIGALYSDVGEISGCIIHQNLLRQGLTGSQYGTEGRGFQITNNIFGYSSAGIAHLTDCVIKYNTFTWDDKYASAFGVKNSVIEHNIGGNQEKANDTNSFADNVEHTMVKPYDVYHLTDLMVKEVDATLSTEHGAFAGETPYVLSGVPAGPVILDVELPNAVVKGEDLNVTVTIGTQK